MRALSTNTCPLVHHLGVTNRARMTRTVGDVKGKRNVGSRLLHTSLRLFPALQHLGHNGNRLLFLPSLERQRKGLAL